MTADFLITGGSGFVGSRVAAAAHRQPGVRVRHLARRTPPGTGPGEVVHGDLGDPPSLRGTCAGADVLVHCATRVGGDPETVEAVNDLGTRALVEEAVRAGVRRILYVSTAAVYGRGPFRGVRPGKVPIAPASATSRTRAAAERHVLEAGGLVLRPHLVYGEGDRWVVPGLVWLLGELSAPLTGCEALHSMIDVDTLGRAVVAAALSPAHDGGVHHVNHPEPVGVPDLLGAAATLLEDQPGGGDAVDVATALDRAAGKPLALHHLGMLTVDHWFVDDTFWKDLDCSPGEGFAAGFRRAAPWYRSFLQGRKAS